MYEELIKALRGCVLSKPCELCPFYDPNGPSEKCATMNIAAADAIEEMSRAAEVNARRALKWAADAEKATEKLRWVPVTERMPEDYELVLCWHEYYHWSQKKILPEYGIGYAIDGRWGGEVTNGKDCKVLAWMLLPKPPKEG